MTDAPEPAISFLSALLNLSETEARAAPVTFQTFSDVKPATGRDPLARVIHGNLADHTEALERLNRQGAGVFISVNGTDGMGRRKGNISRIRGWHCDLDSNKAEGTFDEKAALSAMPLEPNIIIRTPGGIHCYWLALKPMACDGEARWLEHEAELRSIQASLKAHGADPGATTVERVLRIPGFFHRKGEPAMALALSRIPPGLLAKNRPPAICGGVGP